MKKADEDGWQQIMVIILSRLITLMPSFQKNT